MSLLRQWRGVKYTAKRTNVLLFVHILLQMTFTFGNYVFSGVNRSNIKNKDKLIVMEKRNLIWQFKEK